MLFVPCVRGAKDKRETMGEMLQFKVETSFKEFGSYSMLIIQISHTVTIITHLLSPQVACWEGEKPGCL